MLSFWRYVPETGEPVDPAAAGAALQDCHEALRSYDGSLPVLAGVTEAEAMLAGLAAEEVLDPMEAARLLERIEDIIAVLGSLRAPVQPLHGDAHLNNVLNGPDGPALERLGGHVHRPDRLGRRVPAQLQPGPGTGGGGLRRLRYPSQSGGAEAVARGALAPGRRLARVPQVVTGTASPLTLSSRSPRPTSSSARIAPTTANPAPTVSAT